MPTPLRPDQVEIIQCEICMKEIPASEASSAEAQDYVRHFCGLECFDRWSRQTSNETAEEENKMTSSPN